ncbi:uncharacterized protein DDB_G0283697-like [Octopus sinensis]|uniref:Uncharacterized protein DDB_G0283697-like n=1 Tax=Octopus sinensis TaxID=2607531 RepID=A0A7E6EML8_9MOLL|nr:uncharacterized protein DDB_G0283697-like [Octopus sinensis]
MGNASDGTYFCAVLYSQTSSIKGNIRRVNRKPPGDLAAHFIDENVTNPEESKPDVTGISQYWEVNDPAKKKDIKTEQVKKIGPEKNLENASKSQPDETPGSSKNVKDVAKSKKDKKYEDKQSVDPAKKKDIKTDQVQKIGPEKNLDNAAKSQPDETPASSKNVKEKVKDSKKHASKVNTENVEKTSKVKPSKVIEEKTEKDQKKKKSMKEKETKINKIPKDDQKPEIKVSIKAEAEKVSQSNKVTQNLKEVETKEKEDSKGNRKIQLSRAKSVGVNPDLNLVDEEVFTAKHKRRESENQVKNSNFIEILCEDISLSSVDENKEEKKLSKFMLKHRGKLEMKVSSDCQKLPLFPEMDFVITGDSSSNLDENKQENIVLRDKNKKKYDSKSSSKSENVPKNKQSSIKVDKNFKEQRTKSTKQVQHSSRSECQNK